MTDVTTWQEVAVQALNVAQTVLLAYLTAGMRTQRAQLDEIRERSHRVRRSDRKDETPANGGGSIG